MTKTPEKTSGRLARWAALPALALAAGLQAQAPGSVQDFQLPAARPSPTATAAGPVDSEHPTAEATRPAASPTPPPTIVPPPAAASPAPPREAVSPRATQSPSPGTGAEVRLRPPPAGRATPAPAPPGVEQPQITTVPVPAPSADAPATERAAPVETAPVAGGPAPWPWIGGGAVLVLLAGALLYRRASARPAETESFEEPATPSETPPAAARPEPSPPAVLPRPQELNKAPPPPPAPTPEPGPPAIAAGPLEMQFEARHLSRAMINASLAYRLTLTNRASEATGPLRVAGDFVSAHASLSAEEQLLPADAALALLHEAPSLAPGDSVSLAGELRLPIASILPIHRGGARVFVPLARFRAEAGNGTIATRVFVVGQASEQPGGALKPFPLDRGPGVDRGLGQRELGVPA